MAADPKTSAGARLERKAFRDYLRRQLKATGSGDIQRALDWVMKRESRYGPKVGGLGRK